LAVVRQCELAGITRSVFSHHSKRTREPDALELALLAVLDEAYTAYPFYGRRRMVIHLEELGYRVNRQRVQRLMRTLGLFGMAPGPNTSRGHPQHTGYPYLLRGLEIVRPNQVWSTDITYIRLGQRGFVYLVAILDGSSRKVLSWRLSNTLDTEFCLDCLDQA
jgi:putative transposase